MHSFYANALFINVSAQILEPFYDSNMTLSEQNVTFMIFHYLATEFSPWPLKLN